MTSHDSSISQFQDSKSKVRLADKVHSFIQISRPLNCLIAVLGVFAGAYISTSSPIPLLPEIILATIAATLATAGGNTINDYFDFEIDRINKPWRPLPSGALSMDAVLSFAIFAFGTALATAILVNWLCATIAAINIFLLSVYNRWLKRYGFTGNICVAYLVGSLFLFGAAAVGISRLSIILFVMAFLSTFGREVVKDIEDMKGDVLQRSTIPMKIGIGNAGTLAAFFILAAVALSPAPYFLRIFGWAYILPVIIADILFLYSLWLMLGKEDYSTAQKIMKMAMLAAVVAFIAGRTGLSIY